jgi:iron complex transport system ATP-binding protein
MTSGLSVRSLSLALGQRPVLAGVDLLFAPGRLSCILGPNGAGKSTLMRALAGLLPVGDAVRLDGVPLPAIPRRERARRVAYLPQEREVNWPLLAADLVALGRVPHGAMLERQSAADRAAIARAMARADIADLADRPVTELSGGERSRVLLARALATEADVLLADEPVAGLDPLHQLTMMRLFQDEARQGRVVVVVLHDLSLAARFADHVVLLQDGRLMGDGEPEAVFTPERLRAVFKIDAMIGKIDHVLTVTPLQPVT